MVEDDIKITDFIPENEPGDGNKKPDEFTPSNHWDILKEYLPTEQQESFKIPENINKDNEHDLLIDNFKKIFNTEEKKPVYNIHPLAQELHEKAIDAYSRGEKFDINNFFKNVSSSLMDKEEISKISDDDGARSYYKMKYKTLYDSGQIDDDYINNEIAGLSKTQKYDMANEHRKYLLESSNKYDFNPEEYKPKSISQEDIQTATNNYLNNLKELKIGGIDISSQLKDRKEDFQKLFMPDDKGINKISKIQADENSLAKLAFLEIAGDDFFKSMLLNESNRVKIKEILSKMDTEPKIDRQQEINNNNPSFNDFF